ncbi:hypothetical protein JKP88DRAFT_219250 [Tribonema minus]|uniref:Uncharacterized protein n=1 Tax=Tribonema minus TaxID=303371 RepID=A0A835Z1F8_9STRA|nr:hypothetical protein JKP88DRAFT_219250 [Tribonema minus]
MAAAAAAVAGAAAAAAMVVLVSSAAAEILPAFTLRPVSTLLEPFHQQQQIAQLIVAFVKARQRAAQTPVDAMQHLAKLASAWNSTSRCSIPPFAPHSGQPDMDALGAGSCVLAAVSVLYGSDVCGGGGSRARHAAAALSMPPQPSQRGTALSSRH